MPRIDTGRVSLFFEDAGSTPPVLSHELGGCSESWRAVIALLAPECAKPPTSRRLSTLGRTA
jgi:hypothetical protein